jgi:hypothetical protein
MTIIPLSCSKSTSCLHSKDTPSSADVHPLETRWHTEDTQSSTSKILMMKSTVQGGYSKRYKSTFRSTCTQVNWFTTCIAHTSILLKAHKLSQELPLPTHAHLHYYAFEKKHTHTIRHKAGWPDQPCIFLFFSVERYEV